MILRVSALDNVGHVCGEYRLCSECGVESPPGADETEAAANWNNREPASTPTCRICGHTTDSKIHEWCERKEPTP